MDKNTLTGFLLMAAVLFGFMYFNKPSEEEIAAEKARQEQLAQTKKKEAAEQSRSAAEFTAADSANLVAAVRAMGTRDAANPSALVFSNESFNLRVDSTGVSGTAAIAGTDKSVDIRDLLSNRSTLTLGQISQLAKSMRNLSDNALRYEGFARFLSGESKTTVLENEVMKVTFDSRGGKISQVELKKYKTEVHGDSSNILLFTNPTDGYSFSFNTADQRIETRDFNFATTVEDRKSVV